MKRLREIEARVIAARKEATGDRYAELTSISFELVRAFSYGTAKRNRAIAAAEAALQSEAAQ